MCPPNYINHDCSAPVCNQGYFRPYTLDTTALSSGSSSSSSSSSISSSISGSSNSYNDLLITSETPTKTYLTDPPLITLNTLIMKASYRPCNMTAYCMHTQDFECVQSYLFYSSLIVPFGMQYRNMQILDV